MGRRTAKAGPTADVVRAVAAGPPTSGPACAEPHNGWEILCHCKAMRSFAAIEHGDEGIPDQTASLSVRHLVDRNRPPEAIFAGARLSEKWKAAIAASQFGRHAWAWRNDDVFGPCCIRPMPRKDRATENIGSDGGASKPNPDAVDTGNSTVCHRV